MIEKPFPSYTAAVREVCREYWAADAEIETAAKTTGADPEQLRRATSALAVSSALTTSEAMKYTARKHLEEYHRQNRNIPSAGGN